MPLPKGCDMENKSRPWIRSVYYYLKCCMETGFSKMRTSGRNIHIFGLSEIRIRRNYPPED
jgi:hypothetical protein